MKGEQLLPATHALLVLIFPTQCNITSLMHLVLAPENTLSVFNNAAEFGCKWIEVDVQLSQDKVPVVFHDKMVNRCTNGSGVVSEMTLESLKSLDAGLWFGEEFHGERIPTLKKTLLLARDSNLKVNIVIKVYPEDDVVLLCEQIKQVVIDL